MQLSDPTTGLCPPNTAPCSAKTSPENTVCYGGGQESPYCPITEIFTASFDEGEALKNNQDYTVLDYLTDTDEAHYFLVFSKNATDNLPLTKMKLAS